MEEKVLVIMENILMTSRLHSIYVIVANNNYHVAPCFKGSYIIPFTLSVAEVAESGLSFDTVQLYIPSSVAFRMCLYRKLS